MTPLVLFLHGASLCGRDLNRALRYGTVAAIKMGLQVPALVVTPQNPGGSWNPKKLNDVLEWMDQNYAYDHNRVYVLGMSLGGYGTLDFAGTYPDKIAAAMALCGGSTLKDYTGLGELPLWIIHGTADRAVSVRESQKVVTGMQEQDITGRLRYDWLKGASHGALARYFYMGKTSAGVLFLVATLLTCGILGVITEIVSIIQGVLFFTSTQDEFERRWVNSPSSFPLF
jgi:predicted peptidase